MIPVKHSAHKLLSLPLSTLAILLYIVGMTACQAESRYTLSANGTEVTDTQTGLTWRRCFEGMTWSGSACTGNIMTFTHQEALTRAKSQNGWRLPNAKELISLVDNSLGDPFLNDVFPLPKTSMGEGSISWSSTGLGVAAIPVDLSGGFQLVARNNKLTVRLVR